MAFYKIMKKHDKVISVGPRLLKHYLPKIKKMPWHDEQAIKSLEDRLAECTVKIRTLDPDGRMENMFSLQWAYFPLYWKFIR